MREIRFRVWNKVSKEFTFFDTPIITLARKGEFPVAFMNASDTKRMLGGYCNCEQFTGLKDKNGREIYEGDIVTNISGLKWLVVWEIEDARFAFQYIDNPAHLCRLNIGWITETQIEVIGNIHTAPELLEGKK